MTSFGIIGFGLIGRRLAAMFHGIDAPGLQAWLVRPAHAAEAQSAYGECVCTELQTFLSHAPDIVVECASAVALAEYGPAILAAGVDLVPLSLAALADRAVEARLFEAARIGPGRIELAAGALAGLDFLATAREDHLAAVTFRAIYPLARWIGTPAEQFADLARITARTRFFAGSVRQAAGLFPRHLNVSVGVALAGLGLDATQAELFADPLLRQAAFEVEAAAAAGPILLRIGPRDVPAGADPVDHTTFSVMRLLRRRHSRVAV